MGEPHTVVHACKDVTIMAKSEGVYNSYLLRVWRDDENGRIRLRLEEVKENPQILHFADVDQFIGFLLTEPPPPARPDRSVNKNSV
jgi:hypothetical protein